jgi:hypothetical protein
MAPYIFKQFQTDSSILILSKVGLAEIDFCYALVSRFVAQKSFSLYKIILHWKPSLEYFFSEGMSIFFHYLKGEFNECKKNKVITNPIFVKKKRKTLSRVYFYVCKQAQKKIITKFR